MKRFSILFLLIILASVVLPVSADGELPPCPTGTVQPYITQTPGINSYFDPTWVNTCSHCINGQVTPTPCYCGTLMPYLLTQAAYYPTSTPMPGGGSMDDDPGGGGIVIPSCGCYGDAGEFTPTPQPTSVNNVDLYFTGTGSLYNPNWVDDWSITVVNSHSVVVTMSYADYPWMEGGVYIGLGNTGDIDSYKIHISSLPGSSNWPNGAWPNCPGGDHSGYLFARWQGFEINPVVQSDMLITEVQESSPIDIVWGGRACPNSVYSVGISITEVNGVPVSNATPTPAAHGCTDPQYKYVPPIVKFTGFDYAYTSCHTLIPSMTIDNPFNNETLIDISGVGICVDWYTTPSIEIYGVLMPLGAVLIIPVAWLLISWLRF